MSSKPTSSPANGIVPVICLLTTATFWGVSWYPLRVAESLGIHGVWISLFAYGTAAVIGLLLFFNKLDQVKAAPGALLLIGLANAWCNIAFILAVLDGNVVRVVLLFYLSPLWSTLLGWLVLREQLSKRALATLGLAMLGAVIMLWDSSMGMPWPTEVSDWLAISSGMAFSVGNISVRNTQHVSIKVKTMSVWFGVSLLAILWVWFAGLPAPDISLEVAGWTMLIGAIMIFVMTFTVQYGVTHMPVYRSAVILLFELVAATISSQLLTEEIIQLKEWVGGTFIIIAAYVSARSFMEHADTEDKPI